MLTITYNNNDIPLDEGFSIRLSWINPVCFFDKIMGDAGLGIDIPVNDYSKAYFGHPDRFEKLRATAEGRKFENVEIRYDGVLLLQGTLNITSATSETYSAWLQSYVGALGEANKETFITDYTGWKKGVHYDYPNPWNNNPELCFPQFKNGIWWEEKGATKELTKAYYDEDGKYNETETAIGKLTWDHITNYLRYVNYTQVGVLVKNLKGCVISPMLYLTYALKKILSLNKLSLNENVFDNLPELENLVVYNTWSITQINPEYITLERPIFVEEYQPETPLVPGNDLGSGSENPFWVVEEIQVISDFKFTVGNFNYADLVPRISIKDFLLSLQNYFNIAFFFRSDNRVDTIFREHILEGKIWDQETLEYEVIDTFDLDDYFTGPWIIGEQKDVILKFAQKYDKEDRMFGQEYHDLSDRRFDFADAVDTKAELLAITTDTEGTLRLVRSENKIYEFKWTAEVFKDVLRNEMQLDVMKWDFVSTGPQPYLYGEGDAYEDIKSDLSTLIELDTDCVALQKGNMAATRSIYNEFSFRIGYSKSGRLSTSEPTIPASLNWEGEKGIFERKWKNWARFWATRLPVEAEFDLPLNVLYYVVNNITRKFKTEHGEFLIESMETEIGLNLIGKTRIKGYKL